MVWAGWPLSGLRRSLLAFCCIVGTWGCAGPDAEARPPIEVVELTVQAISEALARGEYTAEALTEAYLRRIALHEELYNAFVSLNREALNDARRLDAEYVEFGPRGPLHGVPVAVKDNIDVAGMATTVGFDGFSAAAGGVDMMPDRDATVVARLRKAGAVILGKTNLPDFASHGTRTVSSVAGTTLNPYDTSKAPGGSSGGSATAVNASFAVLGLGTETGGSIQNPAAAQGLVGVKPTHGLVPMEGIFPLSGYYVDVAGPIARSVMDAAVVMDVLTGGDAGYAARLEEDGSETALDGVRLGLVGDGWRDDWLPLAPATAAEYRRAVAVVEELGASVVETPFAGSGFKELYARQPRANTRAHDVAAYFAGFGEGATFRSLSEWEDLGGRELTRFSGGGAETARDAAANPPANPGQTARGQEFEAWRSRTLALFREVMARHELDGLFFPQAAEPGRDLVEDPTQPEFNPNNWPELPSNIVNDLGLPTVVAPASSYPDGMPFVVAFIGDLRSEIELLAWAHALENRTRAREAPELAEPSSPAPDSIPPEPDSGREFNL